MQVFSDVPADDNGRELIDHLAEKGYAFTDGYLGREEVNALREVLRRHRAQEHFRKAGIGQASTFQLAEGVRGDWIKWIDPEQAESASLAFLQKMRQLMSVLSQALFLSLKDLECHYAIYPPGTHYERHLDQFQSTRHRKISFACYLNQDWSAKQGGCLRLHLKETIDLAPRAGRLVLFRSDQVEHEVLTTQVDRYSITGWMRDRPVGLAIF